jgi:MFS family permease
MSDARAHTRFLAYRALSIRAYVPFLLVFLQGRGLSLSAVFDLNVVFILASMAAEIPAGLFADRQGRKRSMVLAGLTMTVASALFIVGRGFLWFAAANALCAISMALSTAADSTWLYESTDGARDEHRYQRLEGYANAAKSLGNVVAIALADIVFSLSTAAPFVLSGALTLLSAVVANTLPETPHEPRRRGIFQDLRRAASTVAHDGRLLLAMSFAAVTFTLLQLTLFTDAAHLPLHVRGTNPGEMALALGALASAKELLTALSAASSGALFARVRAAVVVGAISVATMALFFVMGATSDVACVATMLGAAGLFGLFQPLARKLVHSAIQRSSERATLFSIESAGRKVLFALASALFGRAAESASLHQALRATGVLAVLAYAILAMGAAGWLRVLRRRPQKKDPLLSYL